MIFTKLIKPKWQNADPEVRRTAVKEIDDPNIINEMAQHDESIAVRRAAIHKINDLTLLDTFVQQEADSSIREVALQRFKQLLAGQKDNIIPLETKLDWVNRNLPLELLEYIAKHGQEVELRLIATQRINNQEILADIAITDQSSKVRLVAVENLTQHAPLEQVFKSTRNRDKTVSRIAHDKLNALIEANERPLKIRQECEAICIRLEKLGRGDRSIKIWEQEHAESKHLQNRWQAIDQTAIESELQARFTTAQQAFATALEQFQTAIRLHQQAAVERLEKKTVYCQQINELLAELNELQPTQRFPNSDTAKALQQRIDVIEKQWSELSDKYESEEEKRYQIEFKQNSTTARKLYQQLSESSTVITQLEKINREIQAALEGREPIKSGQISHFTEQWHKQFARLLAASLFADLKQQFNERIQALQQQFEAQKQQTEQATQEIQQQLKEMEIALSEGQLQAAMTLEQQVISKLKHNKQLVARNSLEERLQNCSTKIKELRDWQDWGILLRRKSLCHLVESIVPIDIVEKQDSSESISATEDVDQRLKNIDPAEYEAIELSLKNELLLPDLNDLEDVARFIQNAQTAWKALGAAGYSHQLWEQFNAACNRAYQPCQVYFEGKAQERADNLAKKQKICEKLEVFLAEINWDQNIAWKSVSNFTDKMHKEWHIIGVTNKRDKKAIQKHFTDLNDQIDKKLSDERTRNLNERRGLIDDAKTAAESDGIDQAIQKVKELQKKWHVTVPSKRTVEQAVWKEFRQICDSVFERRRSLQAEQQQVLQDNTNQRASLCERVKALLKLTGEQVNTIPTQLKELQLEWQNIAEITGQQDQNSKMQERQFAAAVKNVEANYPKQLAMLQHKQLILLRQKADLCVEAEQSEQLDSIRTRWETMPKLLDDRLETQIQQRFTTACAKQTSRDPALLERKEILCIRMEILAGIESPPKQHKARMEYQVMRLSEAMSGGEKNIDKQEDAREIQLEWYLNGLIADEVMELELRFAKAREAFYSS